MWTLFFLLPLVTGFYVENSNAVISFADDLTSVIIATTMHERVYHFSILSLVDDETRIVPMTNLYPADSMMTASSTENYTFVMTRGTFSNNVTSTMNCVILNYSNKFYCEYKFSVAWKAVKFYIDQPRGGHVVAALRGDCVNMSARGEVKDQHLDINVCAGGSTIVCGAKDCSTLCDNCNSTLGVSFVVESMPAKKIMRTIIDTIGWFAFCCVVIVIGVVMWNRRAMLRMIRQ